MHNATESAGALSEVRTLRPFPFDQDVSSRSVKSIGSVLLAIAARESTNSEEAIAPYEAMLYHMHSYLL